MKNHDNITYTHAEWLAEGNKRFGNDNDQWKFVCPSCGHVAAIKDWKELNAPSGAIAFSCIGRYDGSKKVIFDKTGGPCNYTNGGLFNLAHVTVMIEEKPLSLFDFAPTTQEQTA